MADQSVNINITATDTVSTVLQQVQGRMRDMNSAVEQTTRKFTSMNDAIASLGGIVSLGAVGAMTKSFIDAGLQLEKMQKLFSAASGSANLGGRELEYVRAVSDRMGLEFVTTAESYGKFTAAMRNTTMEGEKGRKIFESVSGATTALGLSADETKGVFNALQQMISKGKVQAEELRGQLGERLPGAFKLAADAMGVTTAQLDKMLQDGKVLAADLLPKLAEQLDKTYGKAAVEGAKSAQAEINRMNNAMFDSKAAAGSALIPVFTDIVRAIKPAAILLQEFTGGIQILAVRAAALYDKMAAKRFNPFGMVDPEKMKASQQEIANINKAEEEQIAEIIKRNTLQGSDYSAAEIARQKGIKAPPALAKEKKDKFSVDDPGFMGWKREAENIKAESDWIKDYLKEQEKALGTITTDTPGFAGWKREADLLKEEAEYIKQLLADNDAAQKRARTLQGVLSSTPDASGNVNGFAQRDHNTSTMLDAWKNDEEMKTAILAKAKADQLAIQTKFDNDMLQSQFAAAGKATDLMVEIANGSKDAQLAALAIQTVIAVAQIQIAGRVAQMQAFAQLGPIAGAVMAGQIEAMMWLNTGLTVAAGVVRGAKMDGARALGGPVSSGASYLVGERGPEIFTPGASGQITSNDKLNGLGGQTVNVTPVFQISTGVSETARAELARAYPMIIQGAVNAVKSAMRNGQFQGVPA